MKCGECGATANLLDDKEIKHKNNCSKEIKEVVIPKTIKTPKKLIKSLKWKDRLTAEQNKLVYDELRGKGFSNSQIHSLMNFRGQVDTFELDMMLRTGDNIFAVRKGIRCLLDLGLIKQVEEKVEA